VTDAAAVNIIGAGCVKSRGVLKGEIHDGKAAADNVRQALAMAENMADLEISNVFLGVTGQHVFSSGYRGSHAIASLDRCITEDDLDDVMSNARRFNLTPGDHLIHVIRQHYAVDGRTTAVSPVGLKGNELEVTLHAILGRSDRMRVSADLLRRFKLEVENVAFNGLASALAVLTPDQKAEGALVLDIGGGTTDYVVLSQGLVRHSGVIAVGGDHVTQDLAVGLKCPFWKAEEIKKEYGAAQGGDAVRGRTVEIKNELGLTERRVHLDHLRRIMSERLKEVFSIVGAHLERSGALDRMRGGAVLCGGCAHVPGIRELAEDALRMPVRLGAGVNLHGPSALIDRPEFATALGLLKFGAFECAREREREGGAPVRLPWKRRFKGLFGARK